mmetsp:Transcript_107957/g.186210  ORF Transcript_107957/g.186210 Transcript_107957/m.186210 type:complete len:96 (-) Transcript_107957:856-1143(-)
MGNLVSPNFVGAVILFFALVCQSIQVTATICVPQVVSSLADQLTNRAMNTQESKEWHCVCMNPLAISSFTWMGVFWDRGYTTLPAMVLPHAARLG